MTDPSKLERELLKAYARLNNPFPSGEIAFVRDSFIYTINPDGENERRITEGFNPKWNPKGDMIAFQKIKNRRVVLCTISLDNLEGKIIGGQAGVSGDHKRLESMERPMPYPVFEWSPNGKEI